MGKDLARQGCPTLYAAPGANIAKGAPTAVQYAQTAGAGGSNDTHMAITDAPWAGPSDWFTQGGRWKQRYIKKFTNTVDGAGYTDWEIWGSQFNILDNVWAKAEVPAYTSWKRRCGFCHITGTDKANLFSDKVEIGVGCEACHGPGSAHAAATSDDERELTITNPAKLTKEAAAAVCGKCHNRGWTTSNYTGVGAAKYSGVGPKADQCDFALNHELGATTIADWNIDPDGYWNSGETDPSKRVPLKHRMQYPDLSSSKHGKYTSCSDCHRGHTFRIENTSDNNLCTKCHYSVAARASLVSHAKHPYSATTDGAMGSNLLCITCHMVRTAKTATANDETGHTLMKFTPAVEDAKKPGTFSPSTCSQSRLGCHVNEPKGNLSQAAFDSPVAGSLIARWKALVY